MPRGRLDLALVESLRDRDCADALNALSPHRPKQWQQAACMLISSRLLGSTCFHLGSSRGLCRVTYPATQLRAWLSGNIETACASS